MQSSLLKGSEPEEKKEQVEEEKKVIPDDFFYPENHIEHVLEDSSITKSCLFFHESFGFDSYKRYNLHLLEEDVIVFISGITYQLMNLTTFERRLFFTIDGGGIGSLAVHPLKKFLAVAEKGHFPNIYIYEYPSLKLHRILRKGTERSYSNCSFSFSGETLASVGSSPDYMLCVWDWKQENILLKAKAFSQEVYRVTFSNYQEKVITTAGMGHIKFWKIAETFTGLKLKGENSKFGQIELSDITAYYEFPDGKVCSGTEYGKILLWEGNLIKCVISKNETENCHQNSIDVVFKYDDFIVTAGDDGFIKFWEFHLIDNAEGDDHWNYFMEPTREIQIMFDSETPSHIINIARGKTQWIISDAKGKIWKMNLETFDPQPVFDTVSGKINDIACSDFFNAIITVGDDSCIRVWDFINKREYFKRRFYARATCLEWLPFNQRNKGRIVAVGFENGLVRFLLINKDSFFLLKCLKVHSSPITHIKTSPGGKSIAILGKNGNIFFLDIHEKNIQKYEPYCLFETGMVINSLVWNLRSDKILVGCKDGKIVEISVPPIESCDTSKTYLSSFKSQSYTIKMMESQKPKRDEMDLEYLLRKKNQDVKNEDVEWEPGAILNALYFDSDEKTIIAVVDGKFLGYLYIIRFNEERPIKGIPTPKVPIRFLKLVEGGDLLLLGYDDGTVQIRHRYDWHTNLSVTNHDRDLGKLRGVLLNSDKSMLMTASDDGTIMCNLIDYNCISRIAKGEIYRHFVPPELRNGLDENTFSDIIDVADPDEEEILDDKIYSIQEAKLLAEEDHKRSEADKKKQNVRKEIAKLIDAFVDFQSRNESLDEHTRLSDQEMIIDPKMNEMLLDRVEIEKEETKKEMQWSIEYANLMTKKLKNYVMDELKIDKFAVKALRNNNILVKSFKVKKMSEYMKKSLLEIYAMIEDESREQQSNTGGMSPHRKLDSNSESRAKDSQFRASQLEKSPTMHHTTFHTTNLKKNVKEEVPEVKDEQGATIKKGVKYEKERHKEEEEKIRRAMKELEDSRPTQESFEPDHEREKIEAIQKLGDYKLKSAPDFIVPELQRMNVTKKKRHIYLLEEYIYTTKMEFNNTLLSLVERKKNLIKKCESVNARVVEINRQLGMDELLFTPKVDDAIENPDSFFNISDDSVEEYARAKAKASSKAAQEDAPAEAKPQGDKAQDAQQAAGKKQEASSANTAKNRKGMKVQVSDLENEMKTMHEMVLKSEKKRLLDELNQEIDAFDKDVEKSQQKKSVTESDMKVAEMKMITFVQEFLIFIDMEEKDNELKKKLFDYRKEKASLEENSAQIVASLLQIKENEVRIDRILSENKKTFAELVYSEDENKRNKIHQYYTKRFKKNKAKLLKQGNDEEGEDQDEEEDSEDDFMDDDDDEKPDITPIENDSRSKEIIEKIVELEDEQETNKRSKQDYERQKVNIKNKTDKVMENLKKTEEELRDYQREKLKKVNKLDVSAFLKLSQNQNLLKITEQKYTYPENLNDSILFTRTALINLGNRIKELDMDEKKSDKQKGQLKRKKAGIDKEIAEMDEKIEELTKKYEEKHMLKFGDIIDLKIIDALEPTKQVLEMRDRFKLEEKEAIKRVEDAKAKFMITKKKLLEAKRENTKIITNITKLGLQQATLNKKLDSTNKQLFKEENEEKRNDLEREKENLKELVRFLSKEIEDLKTEISLFKRKGGHIYTMVTSNKKGAGTV